MDGRIYAATGNGQFDAAHGGDNFGDTLLSLGVNLQACPAVTRLPIINNSRKATPIWEARRRGFCPDQATSQTPYMIVEGGKDAILKLLNRAALPGVGGEVQLVDLPGGLFSAPRSLSHSSNNASIS